MGPRSTGSRAVPRDARWRVGSKLSGQFRTCTVSRGSTTQFAQAIVDQRLVGAVVIARHEGENRTIPEWPSVSPQAYRHLPWN